MAARVRLRVVIAAVGVAFVEGVFRDAPRDGTIRRVWATCAPAVDAQASAGTGATDLALEIREAAGAVGMGGASRRGVPLAYGLTPAAVDQTIISEECTDYHTDGPGLLRAAARVDAGAGAVVVVTLEVELP